MGSAAESLRETVESYDRQAKAFQATVETDWRRGLEEHCLAPLLGNLGGKAVLDVGAGTGRWSRAALQRGASAVYALEPSAKMAEMARAIEERLGVGHRVRHLRGDVVSYDCRPLAADVAIVCHVLHYLSSREQMLSAVQNLYAALREGGRLVGANTCVDATAPAVLRTLKPRGSLVMPDGNREWCVATATVEEPAFETTLYVQLWDTLRQLLEQVGFKRAERVAASVDEAALAAASPEEVAAFRGLLTNVALFSAEK